MRAANRRKVAFAGRIATGRLKNRCGIFQTASSARIGHGDGGQTKRRHAVPPEALIIDSDFRLLLRSLIFAFQLELQRIKVQLFHQQAVAVFAGVFGS